MLDILWQSAIFVAASIGVAGIIWASARMKDDQTAADAWQEAQRRIADFDRECYEKRLSGVAKREAEERHIMTQAERERILAEREAS